jgi:hypothetical protein
MIDNIVVALFGIAAVAVLFSSRLQKSTRWQATVTPLASIIGSGFLVSVPLLATEVGNWATVAMAGLVMVAYLVGATIRFNIRYAEPLLAQPPKRIEVRVTESLERLSHFALAFAYFISVAYYLVLLGNFLLRGFGIRSEVFADGIATVILAALGCLGFFKGLGLVERIEKYTVGVNLAAIAALIGGLIWYNGVAFSNGSWQFESTNQTLDLHSIRVLLGLLIVVQGFETSRFMGDEYDADTRIRTMRWAQWISAALYLVFFGLTTVLFRSIGKETGISAIIDLVGHVALILPLVLTIGAVASQFSASVADSVGGAGLLEDISARRLNMNHAYPLIAIVSIAIIWSADVFRIITLASQSFALFYLVQGGVALSIAIEKRDLKNRAGHIALFTFVTLFCLCVVIFGIPSGS